MRSIRPPRPAAQLFTTLGFCSCLASLAHAQAGTQSPGQLGMGGLGQVTRFDNGFNPAISFSVDSLGEYADVEGGDDGFDFTLRRLDLLAADIPAAGQDAGDGGVDVAGQFPVGRPQIEKGDHAAPSLTFSRNALCSRI